MCKNIFILENSFNLRNLKTTSEDAKYFKGLSVPFHLIGLSPPRHLVAQL